MVVCEIARHAAVPGAVLRAGFFTPILSSVSVGQLPAVPSFFTSLQTFL